MDYLIIGAGVAGISAVREILKKRQDGDSITVITDEAYPFYYRPRLIECLSGEVSVDDIIIHDQEWFENNDIDFHMNEKITSILAGTNEVKSNKGSYTYDRLLIANGASSFIPPIEGSNLENVFALRDAQDVIEIRNSAEKAEKAVVLGGGLLGLESAYNLMKSGLEVTVVEIMPRLLPMQLDEEGAAVLRLLLEGKGLNFYIDTRAEKFIGEDKVRAVKLSSGDTLDAELVLISAGIRPNKNLLEGMDGLTLDKGIVVNEFMETGIEQVYAAGDIAEFQGRVYGIWSPSMQQGKIAGLNMCGERTSFNAPVPSHKLKVVGINVISVGELDFEENHKSRKDVEKDRYRKIVYDDQDNPIGAIIVGDFSDTSELVSAIK